MTNPDNGEGLIVTREHFSLEMHQKWVQLSASRHHNEQIMAFDTILKRDQSIQI